MPRRYNEAVYRDSVGALLHPDSAARGGGSGRRRSSTGIQAKNYRLDNRANIKEIQAQNRQKREEEAAPAAEPFKLKQFKNVKSRFSSGAALQSATRPGSEEKPAPARDFLRRGSREKVATELRQEALRRRQEDAATAAAAGSAGGGGTINVTSMGSRLFGASSAPIGSSSFAAPPAGREGFHATTDCYAGGAGVTPRKEAVPKAGDVARLAPRSSRDFVTANRMQAVEMKARDVPDGKETFTHDSYGRVPEYLVSRQEEWERESERRKAEAPDPSCPPGMKLMPEGERLSTLKQLQENETACQSQLNKFPLVVQTPLLQRRVDDLNNKLKEIDAAKAIFGRPRVYVARDS